MEAATSSMWIVYNQQGKFLCGPMFDNSSCKIMSRRSDNSVSDTRSGFERNRVLPVTIRIHSNANILDATINAQNLSPQSLAGQKQVVNLGGIALTWRGSGTQAPAPDVPLTGENRVVIDDMTIIAND